MEPMGRQKNSIQRAVLVKNLHVSKNTVNASSPVFFALLTASATTVKTMSILSSVELLWTINSTLLVGLQFLLKLKSSQD